MSKTLKIVLLAGIASLIHLRIGEGDLRVSLGIIILISALLLNPSMNAFTTSLYTGVSVLIFRLIASAFFMPIDGALILSYSLEVFFYLSYGLLFIYLIRHDVKSENNPLILMLMLCDFGANTIESLLRYFVYSNSLVTTNFMTIFLSAFIRSAIIWLIWTRLKRITSKNSPQ